MRDCRRNLFLFSTGSLDAALINLSNTLKSEIELPKGTIVKMLNVNIKFSQPFMSFYFHSTRKNTKY